MPGKTILVVEDETDIRDLLHFTLQREGYRVKTSRTLAEAVSVLHESTVDLLLVDNCLPDGRGIDLIRELQCAPGCWQVPTVLMTGGVLPAGNKMALASALLDKPFGLRDLHRLVRSLLDLPAGPGASRACG